MHVQGVWVFGLTFGKEGGRREKGDRCGRKGSCPSLPRERWRYFVGEFL